MLASGGERDEERLRASTHFAMATGAEACRLGRPMRFYPSIMEASMLNWISRWALRYAPTPEKSATSMLVTARMELFAAEQRVIDAKLQADYWCTRVSFLEVVQKQGIDPWVSAQAQRADDAPAAAVHGVAGPRLAAGT